MSTTILINPSVPVRPPSFSFPAPQTLQLSVLNTFSSNLDIYASFLTLSISFLLYFYLSVYLLPRTHSSPPLLPPEEIKLKTVIFECVDDEGNYGRCWKGDCRGAWKGARVRHCSVSIFAILSRTRRALLSFDSPSLFLRC